jgi:sphingolipid 4-desaturase/C4-monooxygenase
LQQAFGKEKEGNMKVSVPSSPHEPLEEISSASSADSFDLDASLSAQAPPTSKMTTRSNEANGSTKESTAEAKSTAETSASSSSTAFQTVKVKQQHIARSREILAKYPHIKDLYGPDIRLLPSILAITAAQLALSVYAATQVTSWPLFVLLAYSVGGLLTHWLSLGNHELCHGLMCSWVEGNEIVGTVANFAQAIPSFISFKKYHTDHHWFLNEVNDKHVDPDVPTEWEAEFFTTPFRKLIWVILTPAFYTLRPLFVSPKAPGIKELLNVVAVIGFDVALVYYVGFKALFFNFLSTVLGMGLHPVAGHFMSEHYNLYGDEDRQETYSYYGILNYVTFNVGYHVEHHDFPKISGIRLPLVTAIAPEYYQTQHPHYSWIKILKDFIFEDTIGPKRRIIREMTELSSSASGAVAKKTL